jgi:hypothetical protein
MIKVQAFSIVEVSSISQLDAVCHPSNTIESDAGPHVVEELKKRSLERRIAARFNKRTPHLLQLLCDTLYTLQHQNEARYRCPPCWICRCFRPFPKWQGLHCPSSQ